jgi:hypothetical protein
MATGPFIFIATNRLKQGKPEAERQRVPGLSEFIEANEPRILAFNEYANEEGTVKPHHLGGFIRLDGG